MSKKVNIIEFDYVEHENWTDADNLEVAAKSNPIIYDIMLRIFNTKTPWDLATKKGARRTQVFFNGKSGWFNGSVWHLDIKTHATNAITS